VQFDFSDRAFASDIVPAHAWKTQDRRDTLYLYEHVKVERTVRDVILVCELCQGERAISRQVSTFVASKHLDLAEPGLSAQVRLEGNQLAFDVSARSLARFVELSLDGVDVVFSDNYFDLPAGRTVTVTCPLPEGWTLAQARAALRVMSLYDSFA
ncbi:MAG: hypothetical protein JW934_02650, partial [Anaerolineae bacterium]|nr:hypothetical protein [Anaerolineae bacterium]